MQKKGESSWARLAHLLQKSARIGAGAEGLGSELDSGLLSEMICIPI